MLDRFGMLEVMRASRLTQFPISPVLRETHGFKGRLTFFVLLAAALVFTFTALGHDIRASGTHLFQGLGQALPQPCACGVHGIGVDGGG